MNKFLNRIVAAMAAGCFFMPAAECVTDDGHMLKDKESCTETCKTPSIPDPEPSSPCKIVNYYGYGIDPEPKFSVKLSKTRSLPDLNKCQETEETISLKRMTEEFIEILESIPRTRDDSLFEQDRYVSEGYIIKNLFKLNMYIGESEDRLRNMLSNMKKELLNYCECLKANVSLIKNEDEKTYFIGAFIVKLVLKYFGEFISENDLIGLNVLACLKNVSVEEFLRCFCKEDIYHSGKFYVIAHEGHYWFAEPCFKKTSDGIKSCTVCVSVFSDEFLII